MSKKQQHTFELVTADVLGYDVNCFETIPAGWTVTLRIAQPDRVVLQTTKGEYLLMKHNTLNYYHGVCAGVKVQISLKKQEIRAWY